MKHSMIRYDLVPTVADGKILGDLGEDSPQTSANFPQNLRTLSDAIERRTFAKLHTFSGTISVTFSAKKLYERPHELTAETQNFSSFLGNFISKRAMLMNIDWLPDKECGASACFGGPSEHKARLDTYQGQQTCLLQTMPLPVWHLPFSSFS